MSAFEKDYREKIQDARRLSDSGNHDGAVEELDSLNWHKIHNISSIVQASEIYSDAGRDEDAKDLLLMAHNRSGVGRVVLFHLCELTIKMGQLDEAKEYYEDFVEAAPNDYQRYVLKYYLEQKRGADDYTLIGILEELKDAEFLDDWAYQLAYLYHKTNQAEKCIDICDTIALYYGDGIYVEKALELKMLYQPLTPAQEKQYRKLNGEVTEEKKTVNDDSSKKDVLKKKDIPEARPSKRKFDTVNLQIEIKKNIAEIMAATEKGTVDENMKTIKGLVEELPYVNMPEDKAKPKEKKPRETSVMDYYNQFLAEENDGQMSLNVPVQNADDDQISGQMSIQDVLDNWEKTSQAAEAALKESEKDRLEDSKDKAIKEANHIIDRLEETKPLLDAGVDPQSIMKEEILKAADKDMEPATFDIEKVDKEGNPSGDTVNVPMLDKEGNPISKGEAAEIEAEKPGGNKEVKEWEPVHVSPEQLKGSRHKATSYMEAARMMENVNDILQQEIEKLTGQKVDSSYNDYGSGINQDNEGLRPDFSSDDNISPEAFEPTKEVSEDKEEGRKLESAEISSLIDDNKGQTEKEDDYSELEMREGDDQSLLADTIIKRKAEKAELKDQKKEERNHVAEKPSQVKDDLDKTIILEELGDKLNEVNEGDADKVVENLDEEALAEAISDDLPDMELTPDERELFSYFLPVPNMEKTILGVLAGAKARLQENKGAVSGNIAIIGGRGSGKTTLAKAIIMCLQDAIDKPGNNIGKIDAENMNGKDIQELYTKIKGGCLVIEHAGELSRETEITLSIFMENDTNGTLFIIEDTRSGIERALNLDSSFGKKFTERIEIPVFTIDELVNFGIKYAKDAGYNVDQLGKLAMYDRISKSQRTDRPLYLKDVIKIMDSAIDKAGSKGFFHRKNYDEDGNPLLVEKDFL